MFVRELANEAHPEAMRLDFVEIIHVGFLGSRDVSMIFSTACFIAIVAVLIAFNRKKRPNISYDLSLNTIVSVLATACKSSLVFAVGEAISQLKWVWFQDRKELVAMQGTQITPSMNNVR